MNNVINDALIIGDKSDRVFLYVHGNGGSKEEAHAFAEVAVPLGYQVIGIDLPVMEWPEKVLSILEEVKQYLKANYKTISIRANSIGSWYSLMAFEGEEIEQALLVSPLLDMKTFIECMEQRDEAYYEWVVNHPITKWSAETYILRPAVDLVVNEKVYQSFLSTHNCQVEIVDGGEHWFHTPEQLAVLSQWEKKVLSSNNYYVSYRNCHSSHL